MRDEDEGQEDVCGDFDAADGVDHRVAGLAPEIVFVAGDEAVEVEQDGLPEPEPTVADGEDEGGEGEAPDEEVGG